MLTLWVLLQLLLLIVAVLLTVVSAFHTYNWVKANI